MVKAKATAPKTSLWSAENLPGSGVMEQTSNADPVLPLSVRNKRHHSCPTQQLQNFLFQAGGQGVGGTVVAGDMLAAIRMHRVKSAHSWGLPHDTQL